MNDQEYGERPNQDQHFLFKEPIVCGPRRKGVVRDPKMWYKTQKCGLRPHP